MEYLFLTLSVFAGVTKGFCGKRISAYTSEFKSAAFSNLLRMLMCVFIGFFFVLFDGGIKQFIPNTTFILVTALSGVSTAAFVVFWLFAVRRGAYVLVDVFLTLGTLLSAVLSVIFYSAEFTLFDAIGFLLLILASVIMCSYSVQIKNGITLTAIAMLVISATANGISDFSKEIFNRELGALYSASSFNFYTFAFSAILLLCVFLFSKSSDESDKNISHLKNKGLPYIGIMSVCLFLNSFFKTLAAVKLDMTVVSPLSQGFALVLVTIMSAIFFGEKIKLRSIVGLVFAIAGLLIINFL